MMQVLTGISLHAIGASCAALCYTPQKKTTAWAWQTFWLAQAVVCWLLMPIIGAWFSIPHLFTVLTEAPKTAMMNSFLLGVVYGVGGTAFGIAIRYVGYSLTYAIAVGISCVVGTLFPPIVSGKLMEILHSNGSEWIVTGITMGAVGIGLCGLAGRSKEIGLLQKKSDGPIFSLSKGLPLCLLAGVFSAVYGFSMVQGQPIADVAAKYGAGYFQGNVVYLFSNSGAFMATAVYCIFLHIKYKTFGQYKKIESSGKGSTIYSYFLMAGLTGVLWYAQFFFYGLAHVHMGNYKFTSWAIHMIMLVLFSSVAGLIMKEWSSCNRKTINILITALAVLVLAVLALTYGNYMGDVVV
jgi:L-rhamnose-H+ transport protein